MNRRYNVIRKNKSERRVRLQKVYIFIVIVLFWYLLIGNDLVMGIINDKESYVELEKPYFYPCTEANLAKIISYELGVVDDDEDIKIQWYGKDYEYISSKGIVSLKEEDANKLISKEKLEATLKEVMKILDDTTLESQLEENISSNIEREISKEKDYISIHEVINIYQNINKNSNLVYETLVILETPATSNKEAWGVLTNIGDYGFKGLIIEPLINKTIKVAVKDNQILGVLSIKSDEAILENCVVSEIKEGKLKIRLNDIEAEISTPNISKIGDQVTSEIEINKEGRLIINKQGFVLYTSNDELKKDGENLTNISDNKLPTNDMDGGKEDKIISILNSSKNIRVLITNTAKNYEHTNVKVISTDEYNIIYNGKTIKLEPLQTWSANDFEWEDEINKLTLMPVNNQLSELKILTVEKSQGFPKYKGNIEVEKIGDNYHVVNDVGLEEYVANVIPSEMPISYGLEALKVQAVSARTYAVASINSTKYEKYNAHLDDTTSSQVYNNQLPNKLAYEATSETSGEVVTYKENLLSSKFFATSCGYTANSGEVWASGEEFPSYTPPYLSSNKQYDNEEINLDMKNEEEVKKFFKLTSEDIDCFDEESGWFRWNVELSKDSLSNRINNSVEKITTKYPNLVKVKKGEEWVDQTIKSIGIVENMKIIERGDGGIIMTIEINGSENSIRVSTEYLIRYIISGGQGSGISVVRMNGKESGNMSLLPSAFFSPEITYDKNNKLESVVLYGGGFGHGVGMSQDGVLGMIEDGYDYREILEHYYEGVELVEE